MKNELSHRACAVAILIEYCQVAHERKDKLGKRRLVKAVFTGEEPPALIAEHRRAIDDFNEAADRLAEASNAMRALIPPMERS